MKYVDNDPYFYKSFLLALHGAHGMSSFGSQPKACDHSARVQVFSFKASSYTGNLGAALLSERLERALGIR